MNELTKEWIEKAEGDYHTALREVYAENFQNWDAVCFHAQQCIEKYMKARLQDAGIRFGRNHDLIGLLELCNNIESQWEEFRDSLKTLNRYAVNYRYPGETADKQDAIEAIAIMEDLRNQIMKVFS
jgi:HEPN domain-containing protein